MPFKTIEPNVLKKNNNPATAGKQLRDYCFYTVIK